LREVERLVAKFRIQVDNLCQFLPQHNVHDFSRLNSKGLVGSTVDAVGEVELKEKYKELKDLQKNMNEGKDLFERKKQMLVEKTEQSKRLPLMRRRRYRRSPSWKAGWCGASTRRWEEDDEVKMNPLKTAVNDANKKKSSLETKLQNGSIKDCMGKAKTQSEY
jgi:hypothetical protein